MLALLSEHCGKVQDPSSFRLNAHCVVVVVVVIVVFIT